MLNKIHSIAKGFAAKLLLVLLVLSFAVWGIEDMLLNPAQTGPVATVGNAEISMPEFRRAMSRETEKIKQALGENYSPELVKSLQIPQQVLQRMVSQLLMEQEITALGIKVSDADVARILRSTPSFHDAKGNFDKNLFRQLLRSSGLTETDYLGQLREQEAFKLVVDTLSSKSPVNEKAVETLYLSRNQERDVALYIIDTSLISDVAQPSKEQLEAFYKEHQQDFMVPEYRTLSYATFTNEDARKDVQVTEADLQAAYEERIEDFRFDEKRTVEQLLFNTQEKAQEAKKMADGKKSFAAIAQGLGAINKNAISMGSIDRSGVMENATETVFSPGLGGITEPVQSPFGWHIFRVVSIEPAGVTPLEKVKDSLEKDLKARKMDEAVGKLVATLEDAMASGAGFKETVKEFGLKLQTLPEMNKEGKSPDGQTVQVPELDKFMDVAFALDEKTESSVTFSKGGIYYVVYAEDVQREHPSPLESVAQKATLLWQKAERERKLSELMGSMAGKLSDKEEFLKFAHKHNISPRTATDIKRSNQQIAGYNIPPTMAADMFVRKQGDITLPYQIAPATYAAAMITGISPATLPASDKERTAALADIRKELGNIMRNEILESYMAYLATKYPVNIEAGISQSALGE